MEDAHGSSSVTSGSKFQGVVSGLLFTLQPAHLVARKPIWCPGRLSDFKLTCAVSLLAACLAILHLQDKGTQFISSDDLPYINQLLNQHEELKSRGFKIPGTLLI